MCPDLNLYVEVFVAHNSFIMFVAKQYNTIHTNQLEGFMMF